MQDSYRVLCNQPRQPPSPSSSSSIPIGMSFWHATTQPKLNGFWSHGIRCWGPTGTASTEGTWWLTVGSTPFLWSHSSPASMPHRVLNEQTGKLIHDSKIFKVSTSTTDPSIGHPPLFMAITRVQLNGSGALLEELLNVEELHPGITMPPCV